tara:strand:- start:622 stop:900 length:279 start_codon:yes stop_codon:yes gene_type:complete
MANHYYDFEIDDCPIHEDKDTDQFYKLELVLPISLKSPHASWKQARDWVYNFLKNAEPLIDKDIQQVLKYRVGIGHTGHNDGQTCFKYLGEE